MTSEELLELFKHQLALDVLALNLMADLLDVVLVQPNYFHHVADLLLPFEELGLEVREPGYLEAEEADVLHGLIEVEVEDQRVHLHESHEVRVAEQLDREPRELGVQRLQLLVPLPEQNARPQNLVELRIPLSEERGFLRGLSAPRLEVLVEQLRHRLAPLGVLQNSGGREDPLVRLLLVTR